MAIELIKQEIEEILPSIKEYVLEEFEEEIGDLKAQRLLNYCLQEIAPYAYNRGVKDAEQFFREKIEDLQGNCYELERTYWIEKK